MPGDVDGLFGEAEACGCNKWNCRVCVPRETIKPYAGTSGWSGGASSRDRAVKADESGTTRGRQRMALSYVSQQRAHGATWDEVAAVLGVGHGPTSGVLSNLHKDGWVMRLKQRRGNAEIYILEEFVNGRETVPHRSQQKKVCHNCGALQ